MSDVNQLIYFLSVQINKARSEVEADVTLPMAVARDILEELHRLADLEK
jgi:hypothetical protein